MKIVVFGATGRVGLKIVHYALIEGHQVTAFVRKNMKNYAIRHPRLSFLIGDVLDAASVAEAIKDKEMVVSAIGVRNVDQPVTLMSEAIKNITAAMGKQGLKRLIAISGAGILQENEQKLRLQNENFPKMLKFVAEDHLRVFRFLSESDLDWTLVCPPMMPEGECTLEYEVQADYLPEGQQVYTGDVADFIVREISENKLKRKRVGIITKD